MSNLGIISNTTALSAQSNLRRASAETASSISRLSSGERIDRASTDVAGLAIGTILKINVSTLKSSLTNTAQADKMLGVADAALKNISDVLGRQKSLATQATSGTLSDNERAFLNLEFQNLTREIDRIASETSFNGIKLIEGSIFSPSTVRSDTATVSGTSTGKFAIQTALNIGAIGNEMIFNGVAVTLRNDATMTTGIQELNLNIESNTTIEQQTSSLFDLLNNVKNYQGTDGRILDAKAKLSELEFSVTLDGNSSFMNITSKAGGTAANDIKIGGSTGVGTGGGVLHLNGQAVTTSTRSLATSSAGIAGNNGALYSGMSEGMNASGFMNWTVAAVVGADAGATVTINGQAITLVTNGTLSGDDNDLLRVDITNNTTQESQMRELHSKIRQIQTYTGTNNSVLAAKAKLDQVDVAYDGGTGMKVTSKIVDTSTNSYGNTMQIGTTGFTTAGSIIKLDGRGLRNTTVNLADTIHGTNMNNEIRANGKAEGYKAAGTITIDTAFAVGDNGRTLSVNGVAITLSDTASWGVLTAEQRMLAIEVQAGDITTAAQATAMQALHEGILAYTGTDATLLAAKEKWSEVNMVASGSSVKISAVEGGAAGNEIKIAFDAAATTGAASLNGVTITGAATSVDLATEYRGTFVRDISRYSAQGRVGDNILTDINADNVLASGLDVSNLSNNESFIGTISGFTATKASLDNRVNLSIEIGEHIYEAFNVNTNSSIDSDIVLSSAEAGGGSFRIRLRADNGDAVTNQTQADAFATRLNNAFSTIVIYQDRDVTSYEPAGVIVPEGSTIPTGNLSGTSFNLVGNNFNNIKIEKVSISAPSAGSTTPLVEFTIDGEIYRSDSTLGSSIAANTTTLFRSTSDPFKILKFTNGATELDLSSEVNAVAAQKSFETAFGIKNGGSGLTFQVGSSTTNVIEVQIESATTQDIFLNDNGTYVNLSVGTAEDAILAGDVIDNAIASITSRRATVGALQSRFGYAAANLESSIANLDSARGVFLDTDFAEESTNLASAQVRFQASISVLAQANTLPQSLLKLLS